MHELISLFDWLQSKRRKVLCGLCFDWEWVCETVYVMFVLRVDLKRDNAKISTFIFHTTICRVIHNETGKARLWKRSISRLSTVVQINHISLGMYKIFSLYLRYVIFHVIFLQVYQNKNVKLYIFKIVGVMIFHFEHFENC